MARSAVLLWLLPAAVVVGGGLLVVNEAATHAYTLVGLLALLVAVLFWLHPKPKTLIYCTFAVMLITDGEYPGAEAFTQDLSHLFFSQLIPSTLTFFELMTYGTCFWLLLRSWGRRGDPGRRSRLWPCLLIAVTGFVVAAMVAAVRGLASGGQLRIALWQLRSFPCFAAWAIIAFLSLETVKDATRFIRILVYCTIGKAAQGLWIYVVQHGGHLGKIEFLSSHIASLFMGATIVSLLIRIGYQSKGRRQALDIASLALVFGIWLINNRRISMLGLTFTLLFSLLFLFPYITKKHRDFAAVGLVFAAVFAAATWGGEHGLGSLFVKAPNAEIDYRDIENYDLYRAVGEFPLLGRGFGSAFKQYMALPDIGFDHTETLNWMPHNNILMFWAFGGPLNLAALGMGITLFIAVMVRLFTRSDDPELKIFAFVGFSIFVQWTMYIFADMAFSFMPSLMLPAVAGGFAYRLLLIEGYEETHG